MRLAIKVILLYSICSLSTETILLEDLIKNKTPTTFAKKKICLYTGSFDPLHRGHERVVEMLLESTIYDFVFVYPNWSSTTKKLTEISFRIMMILASFEKKNNVIVTRMPPMEVQQKLTTFGDGETVLPKYDMKFFGGVGSDIYPFLVKGPVVCGKKIEKNDDPLSTFKMLPIDSFVIIGREKGDTENIDINSAKYPISHIIPSRNENCGISSTCVKNELITKGVSSNISPTVSDIISKHKLYFNVDLQSNYSHPSTIGTD